MSDINPGDLVTVKTQPPFSNEAGTPTDPNVVKLVFKRRGSPPRTYVYGVDSEIVRDSAGTYHADIPVTKPGIHYFRWVGEEGIQAAEEDQFEVKQLFWA